MKSAIEELAELVAGNTQEAILCVGSDLSESDGIYRGLPSSWELYAELVNLAHYGGPPILLSQLAQIFEWQDRLRNRQRLIQYLQERLDPLAYSPLPIHELIARIPFRTIIHVGWDLLLEVALRTHSVSFARIHTEKEIVPHDRLVVFKPYGSIDTPDLLAVTEQDRVERHNNELIADLKSLLRNHTMIVVGYAPSQDSLFTNLYLEIQQSKGAFARPAYAITQDADEAKLLTSTGFVVIQEEPTLVFQQLARLVAEKQGVALDLPPLEQLSRAPRLTEQDNQHRRQVLEQLMAHLKIAGRVDQQELPLLNEEQLQAVKEIRAAYSRLSHYFDPAPESAEFWLFQGNIEYAHQNDAQAADCYAKAIALDPELAEGYYNLYYLKLRQKQWAEALEQYQEAIRHKPELAVVPARYTIQAILGSGGSGTVYRVTDNQTGQQVAIKLLHRDQAYSKKQLAQFEREKKALSDSPHPNIIRLLAFDEYRGNHYLVMEYLSGQTLRELLATRSQPFALDEAFAILSQLQQALAHLHAQGFVHRDLKPSNVFWTNDKVVLTDFGLAKPIQVGDKSLSGEVAGTTLYIAPEQAAGQPTDQRTDVYGLATLFYELVTKINPNAGSYSPLSQLHSGTDEQFDAILEKGRATNPINRQTTVTQFWQELQAALRWSPDSVQSPNWFRKISRFAVLCRHFTQLPQVWYSTGIFIAILGLVVPAVVPVPFIQASSRYAAVALLLIGICLFIFRIGFRTPFLARYGHLLGILFGIGNALIWLNSFEYIDCTNPFPLANLDLTEYIGSITLGASFFTLLTLLLSYLLAWAAGRVVQSQHKLFRTGFLIAGIIIFCFLGSYGIYNLFHSNQLMIVGCNPNPLAFYYLAFDAPS